MCVRKAVAMKLFGIVSPPDIDIKTKEHNPHDVIEPCRQIVEWLHVTILARIERLLASASLLNSRLQMVFVVCHFWVVVGLDDVLPPFFSQINWIAVAVLNSPAFARTHHPGTLQCYEIILQLAWLLFTLASPPLAPALHPPGAARR